jgi:two-component system sensor histidine kinase TctE
MGSLRIRLAIWLLLPLSVFVAISGLVNWRNAATVADYVQDHDLLSSAKVLSDRLIWEGNDVQASVPPSALSLFASPARDRVFLSVTAADGTLLAGSPGFPLPAVRKLSGLDRAQWYDAQFDGSEIRAVLTTRSMFDVDGAQQITIAVGKTTGSRGEMLRTLWWPTMEDLLLALLLAIGLATLALTWELRPVMKLRAQLADRDPLNLDFMVDGRRLHSELRPVADTINRFAQQLRAHSEAQRRFIADAAHQLRTPLALQASQIEYARHVRAGLEKSESQCSASADLDAVWSAMQASNRRLTDLTNKLLLLAQAEHDDAQTRLEPVDLVVCARRCIEQLAAIADRSCIDMGLDVDVAVDADALQVMAQPALLEALVSNILDNALRYIQKGGRVTLGLQKKGDFVVLTVEDNGPGIPAESRERVFDRFYRLANDTEGTGLGLAIVQEIAQAFGAAVMLGVNPALGTGLMVTVTFPVVHPGR